MSTNLVIAEDQTLVRDSLTALIGFESDLNVVASCGDGAKALSFINDSVDKPDLILTDIEMPNMTGIELAEILQQQQPSIKVVIMTTFAKSGYMRRAIGRVLTA